MPIRRIAVEISTTIGYLVTVDGLISGIFTTISEAVGFARLLEGDMRIAVRVRQMASAMRQSQIERLKASRRGTRN